MMKLALIFLIINLFQREFESKEVRDDDDRVVGGKKVKDIKDYPFVASLVFLDGKKFEFQCGASIIAERWALTAAHCLDGTQHLKFYVGYNSTKWAGNIKRRSVDKRHVHVRYDPIKKDYDIAILHVTKPFPREFIIRMVPPNFQYRAKSLATVLGWGLTDDSQQVPQKTLSYVEVALHDWNSCKKYHAKDRTTFRRTMLCAGIKKKNYCDFDSGGPLYQYFEGGPIEIGVVSWGTEECGESKYSGVYSNLTVFTKWIRSRIRSRGRNH